MIPDPKHAQFKMRIHDTKCYRREYETQVMKTDTITTQTWRPLYLYQRPEVTWEDFAQSGTNCIAAQFTIFKDATVLCRNSVAYGG